MKRNNENGSVMIEFLIVIPIFLTLIYLTVVLGLMIYTKTLLVTSVNNGVHQGTYIGNSSSYTEDEKLERIRTEVESTLNKAPLSKGYDLDIQFTDGYIFIEVKYKFDVSFPIVNLFFDDGVHVLTEKSRGYIQPELEVWEE